MFIPVKPEPEAGVETHYVSSKHITDIQITTKGEYEIITENSDIFTVDPAFDMGKFIRVSNYRDRCGD